MQVNWRNYEKSDKRYQKAFVSGQLAPLVSHNLLYGIDIEIQFLFNLVFQAFGKK